MRIRRWKYSHHFVRSFLIGCVILLTGCGLQLQMPSLSATQTQAPADTQPIEPAIETAPVEEETAPALKLPEATEATEAASSSTGIAEDGWSDTPPCAASDCGTLMLTQMGQPVVVGLSETSLAPQAQPSALPEELSEDGRWLIDTGQPSPDGNWVAYTSIGYESGEPVFLQNLETGAWQNLIAAINRRFGGTAALPVDYMWDVIGWFPDSQKLLIGPVDLSFVAVVEITSSTAQIIPFPGEGRGGRMFVNLAADGSHFIFTGDSQDGQTLNAFDFTSGEITTLYTQSYDQGFLTHPRLSPDGKTMVFVNQVGVAGGGSQDPNSESATTLMAGGQDTLNIMALDGSDPKPLVEGSLWMAVPTWSPDGSRLAFAMAEQSAPALAAGPNNPEETSPAEVRGNVWVVTTAGDAEQITFVDGLARSPTWANNGQMLAFVTHDGQVGLANADRPGEIWQAAGPSEQAPELISAFFLP